MDEPQPKPLPVNEPYNSTPLHPCILNFHARLPDRRSYWIMVETYGRYFLKVLHACHAVQRGVLEAYEM